MGEPEVQPCCLCGLAEDDQLKYGQLFKVDGLTVHHFCMLFSPNLAQNGKDDEGAEGFLAVDIRKEIVRSGSTSCCYCTKGGATGLCMSMKCKKHYHPSCAVRASGLLQFFGQFKSFCEEHRPRQNVVGRELGESCGICLERTDPEDDHNVLWTPCCRHFFHRACLQRMAYHFGYFFYCPGCRNKDNVSGFLKHMRHFGIFIPKRDASWEMVPNAFGELLERHLVCDVRYCLCSQGRSHQENDTDSPWRLCVCGTCGSAGTHLACSDLDESVTVWSCPSCTLEPAPANKKSTLREFMASRAPPGAGAPPPLPQAGEGSSSGPAAPPAVAPLLTAALSLHEVLAQLDEPERLIKFTVNPLSGLSVQTRPVSGARLAAREPGRRPVAFSAEDLLPEAVVSVQDVAQAELRLWSENHVVSCEDDLPEWTTYSLEKRRTVTVTRPRQTPAAAPELAQTAPATAQPSAPGVAQTAAPSAAQASSASAVTHTSSAADGKPSRNRPRPRRMVAVARSSPSKLRRLSRASDPADRQCAASSDSDTSDCDDPDFLAEIAPGPSDRPAPVKRSRAADDSASAPRPQKVLCDGVQRSIPAPIVLDSDSDEVTIIDDEPAQKVEHQPTRRAEHQPTQSVNRQPAQRVEQQPTQKVEHQTAQRTEYRTAQKTGHQPGLKTKTDGEGAKTDREGSKTDRLETKTGREGRQTNRVRTYSEQKAAKTTREDAQDAQMKELCRARQALYGFPCPVCDKKSETLTQATLHYHRHDSATALFRCKICDEKFAAWQPNHIRQRHPHIRGPDIFSTIENNFEQGKRNLVRLILEKKKLYSETILDKVMKITVNLTMVRKQRPVTKPPPETSGALAILASAREKEQEQKRAEELKRKKLAALKALRIGKAIKSESGSKRQPIDVKTNDSNTGTARSSVETPQPSTDAKLQTRPESSSRAASASAVRSDNCDGITTCEQCNFRGISVAVRRHAYWHTDEARRRSENLPHSCHLCFYATEVRTHLQVHLMCVHFVERPGWDSGGGRPGKLPRPDPCNAGPPPEEQARCLRQRRYDCPMCDSFFAERSEFAAHVRRLHIKGRSAPRRSLCPFPHCYHKHDADHIKWYHKTAPLRNRICEDCGGTFYYGKDNQHGNGACVRERSESYECPMPICGFGTRLLANMDRHLVECHSLWVRGTAGPRSAPYFCPVCSAEVSYDEFLNHLGQHDEQVEDVDDPGDLESEDPASVDDTDDAEVKDDPVPVVPIAAKDTARPDRTQRPSTTEVPGGTKVTSRPDRTHGPNPAEVPVGAKDTARPGRTHRPSTTEVSVGTKDTARPDRTHGPNPAEVPVRTKDTARPDRTHRPNTTEVSVGRRDTARPDRTQRPSTTEVLSGRRDTARPDRTHRPSTTEVHSGRRDTARPDRTHRQSTTEVPGGTKVTSRPDRTREPNPTEVPVAAQIRAKDASSQPDMAHRTYPVNAPLAAKDTARPDKPSPMEVSVAAQTRAKGTANQPDSAQTGAVHGTHDSARTGRDTKTERRDERAATADGPPAAAPPSGGWSQLSVGRFLTERCSQTLQQEAYSQPRGGYQTRGGVDRCFFCPFRADDTRRLELHLAAAHPQQVTAFDMFLKGCVTKLGTKKCPMCNVGFRAKWALFRHVMSHTMNVPKVEGV